MTDIVKLAFMNEKVTGHGEDAPPLLFSDTDRWAVAVFDGMGGAGSTICSSDYGEGYTKAYVASRIVKELVSGFIRDRLVIQPFAADELCQSIHSRLQFETQSFPPKIKSVLRSRLVREYPTTMAMVTAYENENGYFIDSYWAGDSRCYIWTKEGFFQFSKDDLEEDNDPMRNLHNDSALSNCICADQSFIINHGQITLPLNEPFVIMSATDGCFGYFQTPMHFEQMIRESLSKANNNEEWGKIVEAAILKVAGDDTSMALLGIGFKTYTEFRKFGKKSLTNLNKKINLLKKNILSLEEEIAEKKKEYIQLLEDEWDKYKKSYMKLIIEGYISNVKG